MNCTAAMLFGLALVASIMPARGADPSAAYEQLKPLEWELGNWVTEYQAAADSGPIKKGDLVTVHFSVRWSPDRSFLVNNSFWEVSGKRVATAMEVISWNSEKSAVTHSYYGTWGTGEGVWTKVGDTTELEWTIRGQHGTFRGTSYGTKGDDTWQWQIREQTHNGQKMPDMPLATFRRETGQAAGDLWNAYRDAAVGTWNGQGILREDLGDGDWASEVEIGGTVYRGTWIVEWSLDKTCLISHWAADTPSGPACGTRVEGWDALAKEILVVDFGSKGTSSIERYPITSNQVSEGEMTGVDDEGKPMNATARVLWKGPDFFTWIVTRDGQATEYRFRRVKKATP